MEFKNAFASAPGLIHLNNAGLSRISLPAAQAVRYWADRFFLEGVHCNDDYMAAAEAARKNLALLAGSDAGEIAFFQSTAGAISQVAFGLDLKSSDEIVLWDQEYGSNLYPWTEACKRTGAHLKIVESPSDLSAPLEKLLAAVTAKTKIIAISWVQYQTGSITDLKALTDFAKARGIFTVVDIIQGFGARPFHFHDLGIDFACGGSHKWLASPVGVGFLIVRKEHISKLRPLTIGMSTYGFCDDTTDLACRPKSDALRFESGSKQVLEITALGASAQLIHQTSPKIILQESERLGLLLRQGLKELGFTTHENSHSALPFVNFSSVKQDKKEIAATLKNNHISFAFRGPGIRLSPHAHNTDEDIHKTLNALKTSLR